MAGLLMQVKEKLRSLEVEDENQNEHPRSYNYAKNKFHMIFVANFIATEAFQRYVNFILNMNEAIIGVKVSEIEKQFHSISLPDQNNKNGSHDTHNNDNNDNSSNNIKTVQVINLLLRLFNELDEIIDDTPPLNNESSNASDNDNNQRKPSLDAPLSRFGNVAFRSVLSKMQSRSIPILLEILRASDTLPSITTSNRSDWKLNPITPAEANIDNLDSNSHFSHVPARIPDKVIESMRARGESPEEKEPDSIQSSDESMNSQPTEITKLDEFSLSDVEKTLITFLGAYLHSSFGDERRIDYGTGHEMNFLCFLYTLCASNIFYSASKTTSTTTPSSAHESNTVPSPNDLPPFALQCLALIVFPRYLKSLHRLQEIYWLEPAGSRGVWGLDDYSFLPFLFGSAQLIPHKHLKPKSVRYSETVEAMAPDYLYFDAISFILKMKSCSFAEHSPMLYDITACTSWQQVNKGLIKMYEAEVLKKYAVVQHFIFSPFFPTTIIKSIDINSVTPEAPPCCSDIVHFPSALAAAH